MKKSTQRPRLHANLQDLFANAEQMPNGCIEWRSNISVNGYARLTINKRLTLVHRYVLELTEGLQEDLCALHSCDNPPCINPSHLRWGTIKENNADTISRNRKSMPRGENHSNAILTSEQVQLIRAESFDLTTRQHLANKYNVSVAAISAIMKRKSWGWLN